MRTTAVNRVPAPRQGTLADRYSGRDNAIGLIRLLLAVGVVLSHSRSLGFGQSDLGFRFFHQQTSVGVLSVYGFFVLSGLLITRSARGTTVGRYAWRRAMRIFPGLWVCLLVTALVVAPLLAVREHGNLNGFWAGPAGPLQYLSANWWSGVRQWGIHDLLVHTTPWGRYHAASVFDGALWSLCYEVCGYVVIGVFAAAAVLKRAPRLVPLLVLAAYFVIVTDYWDLWSWTAEPLKASYSAITVPLLGPVDLRWVVYLGFLFLLGSTFELYRERIPVHDGLGIASAVVTAVTLHTGGFYLLGFPAYGYLLVWLGIRLPPWLRRIGRRNDYSYGIYIYGFVGQQVFASLGYTRWGYVPFAAISVTGAFVAAFLSWHLVEKHALALKDWAPFRRRAVPQDEQPVPEQELVVVGASAEPGTEAGQRQ